MRVLDVSVAAVIGLSSVAVLIGWSPYSLVANSQLYSREASLGDYLTTIVSTRGVAWFQRSNFTALCSTVSGYSNSTVKVSAEEGDLQCNPGPPSGAAFAALTIELAIGDVTLEAWQVGEP